jgi:DNA-binding PucR family transcriptional regulator
VVLLLEDADPAAIQAMIPSLLGASASRWALGVSEAFTDLSTAHDALNQAQVALASTADHHVAFYDTMGPTVDLLKHLQAGAATRFVDELLSPLLEYDRAHNAALTETLDAYLRNRCSLRGAAADLYVHTNTVQLRLARAATVTGMDLHDPRQLGLLSIAFAWRSHWATEDPDAPRQG